MTLDLQEGLPFVAGDRAQLSQLLHNLIGNAMKYGRAGTPVTIARIISPAIRLACESAGSATNTTSTSET